MDDLEERIDRIEDTIERIAKNKKQSIIDLQLGGEGARNIIFQNNIGYLWKDENGSIYGEIFGKLVAKIPVLIGTNTIIAGKLLKGEFGRVEDDLQKDVIEQLKEVNLILNI